MEVKEDIESLEKAINESIKIIKEKHGIIITDIPCDTTGYHHDGTIKVESVKIMFRV